MALSDSFKRTLSVRALSGVVLVAAILLALWAGGLWWRVLASVIALGSLREYYAIHGRFSPLASAAGYGSAIFILLTAGNHLQGGTMAVTGLCCFVAYASEIFRRQIRGESDSVKNVMPIVAGLIYTVIPWHCMIQLRMLPYPVGFGAVLCVFLCTWSCDVMAYLVGSFWGTAKVCPHISPNKSMEGFVGGFAASVLCGALCALCARFSPLAFILTGVACGTAGQLGDLAESLIKREQGVKDSGHIIPGHGGFLDRFDSVLVNAVCAWLIWWVAFL
ncbi:MAG: phosphatidate cytidylyltransferase [Pyramidobacter sp.]